MIIHVGDGKEVSFELTRPVSLKFLRGWIPRWMSAVAIAASISRDQLIAWVMDALSWRAHHERTQAFRLKGAVRRHTNRARAEQVVTVANQLRCKHPGLSERTIAKLVAGELVMERNTVRGILIRARKLDRTFPQWRARRHEREATRQRRRR